MVPQILEMGRIATPTEVVEGDNPDISEFIYKYKRNGLIEGCSSEHNASKTKHRLANHYVETICKNFGTNYHYSNDQKAETLVSALVHPNVANIT